ncbi:MAG: glutaredoxin 3 [Pseudomonadota bacterium]|nr:glutaredoxin 3 [Pseudomonadota bacterium]
MSVPVTVYTTPYCPYCIRAKQLLSQKQVEFKDIDLSREPAQVRTDLMSRTRHRTVPQIFIGEQFIGGCDELFALERQGKLDALLSG